MNLGVRVSAVDRPGAGMERQLALSCIAAAAALLAAGCALVAAVAMAAAAALIVIESWKAAGAERRRVTFAVERFEHRRSSTGPAPAQDPTLQHASTADDF